jgi:methylenetetrahydrofolate reductase (NADPH)
MKVTEHFAKPNHSLFSMEILPPVRGKGIEEIWKVIDPLMEFKPPFVDVTYHREEYVYKKRPNGLLEKVTVRKRPGTIGICAGIKERYKIDPVPHLICGGFNKQTTEDALVDLSYLGIDNVLVIRGDAIKSDVRFAADEGGHNFAIELLEQVVRMNRGIYIDDDITEAQRTDFCIGVAGYPEKHFESPNLSHDMKVLKAKVDAGAHYVVTQMFFDNQRYFDFVKRCRESGIHVPIVPGIKPITTLAQVNTIPSTFKIDIPEELSNEVSKCRDNTAAMKVGIEWTTQQCKELLKFGVPCIHFYTMSRPDATLEIGRKIF